MGFELEGAWGDKRFPMAAMRSGMFVEALEAARRSSSAESMARRGWKGSSYYAELGAAIEGD